MTGTKVRVTLTLLAVAGMFVSGAASFAQTASNPASKPASSTSAPASAAAPATKPDLKYAHVFAGHDYYSVVLRSKDIAKFAVSATRLKSIGQVCVAYALENDDRFPPSLDTLTKGSYGLTAESLQSPVDPKLKYVYVPGAKTGDADRVVAFDPVSYDGRIQVLFGDGSVKPMNEQEFTKAVENLK